MTAETLDLNAYLARIGYTGPVAPTAEALRGIHRAHLLTITYENLDIHLSRPLSLDIHRIYTKIVRRGRGGWCYEMNGLLAWALREVGFEVNLLAGTVGRERLGAVAEGNHLVLLVKLDESWLADAGFGNGLVEPIPLRVGNYEQNGFGFRLERVADRWFFHNQPYGGPGFDFTLEPYTMDDFAERCHWLQTSPDSGFVRVPVCHRWRAAGLLSLRGAILQTITPDGIRERPIETVSDYGQVLAQQFNLNLNPELPTLWPKVQQAHQAWLETQRVVA